MAYDISGKSFIRNLMESGKLAGTVLIWRHMLIQMSVNICVPYVFAFERKLSSAQTLKTLSFVPYAS